MWNDGCSSPTQAGCDSTCLPSLKHRRRPSLSSCGVLANAAVQAVRTLDTGIELNYRHCESQGGLRRSLSWCFSMRIYESRSRRNNVIHVIAFEFCQWNAWLGEHILTMSKDELYECKKLASHTKTTNGKARHRAVMLACEADACILEINYCCPARGRFNKW